MIIKLDAINTLKKWNVDNILKKGTIIRKLFVHAMPQSTEGMK